MKTAKLVIATLVVLGIFLIAFLVAAAGVAVGQTNGSGTTPTTTVQIPYDFWIVGTRLPAGEYTISPVVDTVVLFHNAKTKAKEQASLMPTGEPVPAGDHKLVFVEHNGQHYLREIWNADGRQIVTSQLRLFPATGDTVTEVRLVERKGDAAGAVKAAEYKSALQ
jgi:hypothetical protein